MQYDINKFPLKSIERVKEQLKNHDLNKALKTMNKNNIKYNDVQDELKLCIDWLYKHKSYGVILSAYYKFGNCASYTVNELLKRIYEINDFPGFLKQAYRFDIFKGFENEIENSIKWHENKKLPDAKAWRIKFNKINEINRIQEIKEEEKPNILSIQEDIEDFSKAKPKTLIIKPIKRNYINLNKLENEPDNDPYIISKVARIKIENANNLHNQTIKVLKEFLRSKHLEAMETKLIDTYSVLSSGPAIFEVKSITESNEREQIRHAISQLYEYRFLHSIPDASLWIVFSQQPFSQWYINYLLNDRCINVLWVEEGIIKGPSVKQIN